MVHEAKARIAVPRASEASAHIPEVLAPTGASGLRGNFGKRLSMQLCLITHRDIEFQRICLEGYVQRVSKFRESISRGTFR